MPWVWSDELADALAASGLEESVLAALRSSPVAVAVPARLDPIRCAAGLCGADAPATASRKDPELSESRPQGR